MAGGVFYKMVFRLGVVFSKYIYVANSIPGPDATPSLHLCGLHRHNRYNYFAHTCELEWKSNLLDVLLWHMQAAVNIRTWLCNSS